MSYFKNGRSIEVLGENNYYPFGLKHEGYNELAGNSAYQYKYQGQELQTETGWYSFKWRNYMPDLGRFFNVDPLAEKYVYNSVYAFQENKMGLGRELEGLELLQQRGLITATGMTENDIYTREPLPSYMSSYTLHPDKPDPQLMDAAELPSGVAGMGKWNNADGSFSSFAGEAKATKALGIFEVIKLVNTGIDGIEGMKATAENVKAVKYMDKLTAEFKDMKTALDVVNKADLKLDNKTKTEVTNYVFDGSLPKDVNSRSNSVVNLGSKANIVNTANSIMRKNDIIVRNSPEVQKRQELEQQRMDQKNKQQNIGR